MTFFPRQPAAWTLKRPDHHSGFHPPRSCPASAAKDNTLAMCLSASSRLLPRGDQHVTVFLRNGCLQPGMAVTRISRGATAVPRGWRGLPPLAVLKPAQQADDWRGVPEPDDPHQERPGCRWIFKAASTITPRAPSDPGRGPSGPPERSAGRNASRPGRRRQFRWERSRPWQDHFSPRSWVA